MTSIQLFTPVESAGGPEGLPAHLHTHHGSGTWFSLHVSSRVVVISLTGPIRGSQCCSTLLLHTYPTPHPLLPPLSLASLITCPLTFSLTHSITHPFTRSSFISLFSYTTCSSNTSNPLSSSNFTSHDTPVLTSPTSIPTLQPTKTSETIRNNKQ